MIVHAASLLALTAVLASRWSLGLAGIPKPPAGAHRHEPSGQGTDTQFAVSRIRKYHLRFARAADIAYWLGGSVLTPTTDSQQGPPPARVPWPVIRRGTAMMLLPDGIDSLTAYEADNTLIIKYSSDDGLRELEETIQLLDVRPPTVDLHARATLTMTDHTGHRRQFVLEADGITGGDRRVHLKTTIDGDPSLFAGARLASQTSDVDIYAYVLGNGAIDLNADWYVDFVWRVPGAPAPLKLHNIFRTDGAVAGGHIITLTRARLQLPSGTAGLVLQVTPRIAPDVAGATKASSLDLHRSTTRKGSDR